MKDNIEKRMIGLFALILAILIFVTLTSVHTIKESIESNDWVNKTHDVIRHAGEILSYLNGGDAALRTYLITGDEHDKQAYRVAYSIMKERFDEGDALTRSGAEAQALHPRFVELGNLISNRFVNARDIVNARETDGMDGVRKLFAAHPEIESLSKIERTVKSIIDAEDGLLIGRDARQHLQAQATKTAVYVGLTVNFALLVFAFGWMRDDLHARRTAACALEEANAHLEAKVQERTAELVLANNALKQENLERRWANQALDHQFRYNQLIINSIAEIVFVISRAMNISRVNPAAVQRSGWEPQDLVSHPIQRVLQLPPDPAATQNPLAAAMKDGRELQSRPAILLTRAGLAVPILYSLVPLRDQDKVVGGVITVRPQPGGAPANH